MTRKACENCGKRPVGYDLLDYCATCSRDLCDGCMEKGCCGHVPAISGEAEAERSCTVCYGSGGIAATEDRHGRRQVCQHCGGSTVEPKI